MTNYEKYQLQWMIDHGFSLKALMSELANLQFDDPEDSAQISTPVTQLFEAWVADVGFGSEMWACEDEWRSTEGQETTKRITLLQMKSREDGRFMPLAEGQTSVDLGKYEAVWSGFPKDLRAYDAQVADKDGVALLKSLYFIFNQDNRPGAKEFCSMSVSDVVALTDEGDRVTHYYCDSFGFKEVAVQ